jgi:hypothetical protein
MMTLTFGIVIPPWGDADSVTESSTEEKDARSLPFSVNLQVFSAFPRVQAGLTG